MADNVELNAGTGGATLATDDVGGVHYQKVKIVYGGDDSATQVSDSNPLPIDDAGGSLTVDGTVTANLSATDNAVLDQIEVNTSYGDNTGGGAEAGALRVTIASDSTGVLSVDDNGASLTVDGAITANAGTDLNTSALALESGGNLATLAGAVSGTEMQVDVVASLPAGTNAIGKLAANSGVDIGDVDVASIAAGANLIGDIGLSGTRTSGGTTPYKNLDVDESADEIKASAGQIYWLHAMNLSASVVYLKLYDALAADVNSTAPPIPVHTFPIATQGDTNGAGFTLSVPNGIAFSVAISLRATTTLGDDTHGAPGANEVVVNLGYA